MEEIFKSGNGMEEELYLTCESCGCDFFSEGERKFYLERKLLMPRKCKNCRENIKKYSFAESKKALQEIDEYWKLEAKQEENRYFYNVNEVNDIFNGKKHFVIGRKGSGKTAIAQYIYDYCDAKVFSEKLSFKNFPFNYLYALENAKYTAPNQYITIWKYLIYSCVCKMMTKNESIDSIARGALQKIYDPTPIKSLSRLVDKWTAQEFGVDVLGVGLSLGGGITQAENLSWIEKTNILEDIIAQYLDDSKYFIIIDELDEDYREFENSTEKNTYVNLLTSLFKAVQDIRATFKSVGFQVFPVVFLRSDIYALIKDSDKNKWSDFRIDIDWSIPEIQKLLAHRLSKVFNLENLSFNFAWNSIFSKENVRMGNKGQNLMEIFSYITRSTHLRPRDYIHYIQECAHMTLEKNQYIITPETVKAVDNIFSEYLRDEIIDEIHAVMPDIYEVLGIISQIRKQTFSPNEFLELYNEYVSKGNILLSSAENILIMLFEFGVIGNVPSMRGQKVFKYENKNARFNFRENIIVHRGLFKALQIF